MKKVFLITILTLIALVAFFLLRKGQLERAGTPPQNFRDFFSLGSKASPPAPTPNGGLSSDFTDGTESPTNPSQAPTTPTGQPIRSAFGTIAPGVISPQIGTSGTGAGNQGNPTIDPGTPDVTPILPPDLDILDIPEPVCRPDDLEIAFTSDELARLKTLEAEFYTLAPTLRSDQDVSVERGNWSNYVLKSEQFLDMNTYCEEVSPKLPSGLRRYLRTPFWNNDGTNPATAAFKSVISFVDRNDGYREVDLDKPSNNYIGYIERFFKLNIW